MPVDPHLPIREDHSEAYPSPALLSSVMPERERVRWHEHPLVAALIPMLVTALVAAAVSYATQAVRLEAQGSRLRDQAATQAQINERNERDIQRIDEKQRESDLKTAQLYERLNGLVTRFEDALRHFEQRNQEKRP